MVQESTSSRWVRFASLLVLLTLIATAFPSLPAVQAQVTTEKAAAPAAQPAQPSTPPASRPVLTEATAAISFDGDLRSLSQGAPGQSGGELALPDPEQAEQESGRGAPAGSPETSLRHADRGADKAINAMPAPSLVFDGLTNLDNLAVLGGTVNPPDPTGDVGPNHYVQAVNLLFRIYDKSGTPLIPPTKISTLFAAGPSNTPCDTADNGDPIVVYDTMADRWLVTQFAVPGPDYYECIAISKTGDPVAGGWWLYVVRAPFRIFNDYPKVTVWPDGYYMSAPMFPDAGGGIYGGVWALDRMSMLAGLPLRQYYVTTSGDFPRVLPSNLRGMAPPAGSPAYVMSFQLPDKLALWKFDVDWDNPANTSFTGPTMITVDAYTEACPGTRDCVPFLGVAADQYLDDLSPRLMQQLQYRRVGATESLWVTQTISATGRTALRWYEIRDFAGATPTVFQQSTYTPPDGVWRWMASIAADKDGNAAIGYSASSPLMKPAVWYSGRLVTDPINTLAQGDGVIKNGDGNPTTTNSRWGDYSIMSVDPVDDCTFWYQNEYYKAADMAAGAGNRWSTAIGAFKFPSCTPLPATGTISGTVTNGADSSRLANMPISIVSSDGTRMYAGSTDANGVYTINVLPGTYTVTAGPKAPAFLASGSVSGVTVTSGATTIANIVLAATPNLVRSIVMVDDTVTGNGNNALEPGEQAKLTIMLENIGLATATGVSGTLVALTPGVRVTPATSAYPNIAPAAQGGNLTPFTVKVDALRCGVTLKFRLDVVTAQRSFSIPIELPTGFPGNLRSYSSTGAPVAIPNNNVSTGAEKSVVVNEAFALGGVNVTVNITHPNDADIQIHLTSPSGQEVELSSDNGGTGDNYTNTVFADNAPTSITAGTAPFTGTYRPEGRLSDLDGTWSNGTWTLHAYDDNSLNSGGQLGNFTLSMRAYECTFAIPNLAVSAATARDVGGNTNHNGLIDPGENYISMTVDLLNTGIPNLATATGVTGIITPANPTVHMINKTSAYPDIPINGMRRNLTPYTFSLDANHICGVPLDFTLAARTSQGLTFTDMFSVPTGGNPVATTALSDSVENGANGWTTQANLPGIGWTITTESAHSPTHSWSDSPNGNYVPSANVSLISPVIDFSAYDTVSLSFWQIYDLEEGYDYGYVEYSIDGGATWKVEESATVNGTQAAWTQATVSLPGLAHATTGQIRFHMVADTGVEADGWHIDDIRVSGAKRSCTSAWKQVFMPRIMR